jgi:hypothetical protein
MVRAGARGKPPACLGPESFALSSAPPHEGRSWSNASFVVIPAKAGIQDCKGVAVALDSSLDLIRGSRRG